MTIKTASPLAVGFAGAAAALALSACAANDTRSYAAEAATGNANVASAARSCFRISNIRSQKVLDNDTVLFSTGLGRDDVYKVDMRSACLTGALASDPLILRPTGASDVVCDRMDLDIGVKTPIGATPCMIENVRRLTSQEVAAMPPRDLP